MQPSAPDALKVAIEPAQLSATSGESLSFALTIRNDSPRWQRLDLGLPCGVDKAFAVSIHRGATRVDEVGECHRYYVCQSRTVRLALAPSGTVMLPLTATAQSRERDANCQWKPPQPLSSGEYMLEVGLPESLEALSGGKALYVPLRVQ
ncbi:MAG: hypothetical protein R3B13_10480 [Polyangiaceae bacterium]